MSKIIDRLNNISQTLNSKTISQYAYQQFVKYTPKRSGYAKMHTVLQGTNIVCDYNYGEVLDKGRHMTTRGMRGSQQAPQGMTKPTISDVREYVLQRTGIKIQGY